MEFNSLLFLFIYMPIFVGLMYFIKNNGARNAIIVFFSLLFYVLGNIKYFYLIILVSSLSYATALVVRNNKRVYFSYLAVVVLFLCFCKYGNCFLDALNLIFVDKRIDKIIMPLGVSFYVFTSISYVSDCFYGKIEHEKNYLNVLTFSTFFPTVISGPLLRYEPFHTYLNSKEITTDSIAKGLRRFIIGLAKKVLIANQLAMVSSEVFGDVLISFPLVWYGVLSYTLQLYFDFSGYSDMAIGIAEMIGFNIPENFNFPYEAISIQDFWRRWHISLTTWFRDYVYIPLGGNRVSKPRRIVNVMIVWILTGIWHGSSFNYVVWGVFNGICLLIYSSFLKKIKVNKVVSWLITMLCVVIGWTIFNTNSISQCLLFIKTMFFINLHFDMAYIKSLTILKYIPYFVLGCATIFSLSKKALDALERKCPLIYDLAMICALLLCVIYIISGTYASFIYFGF